MESRISVPEIASEAQQKQRYERLRTAVSALPGVESVALAKELPLMLGYNETPAQVRDNDKQIPVARTVVDADYFATFGIRVALGAGRWELLKMILRQTLRITGAGVAIGILLGVGVTIGLRSQFYGISPVEWMVLVPVGAAMLAVSLLVAYLSARPWITVDPLEAVRHT